MDETVNATEVNEYAVNWYGLVDESIAPYDSIAEGEEIVLEDEIAYAADIAHFEKGRCRTVFYLGIDRFFIR